MSEPLFEKIALIGIGLVLAAASAGRMYAVNWLG